MKNYLNNIKKVTMMKNKINFVSGETYSLSELFSGNRKIIIPDLQRDYCWGNKEASIGNDLVGNFMESLTRLFKEPQRRINLGLIYGYEAPENHIQLCDGQQRITTLFLLLGLLNKKTKENLFRQYLISDYEYLQDDKEPYLLYAIRESSLYFLSDLVCNFFIETKAVNSIEKVEDIKKATWFFNEYNNDPSIQSMLKALSVLENKLDGQTDEWCSNFGYFLIEKLSFLYYDLENRNNGEETFVVINTTGEPLSATQNLKPLVINAKINENYERNQGKKIAHDWEEIDTYFWKKRNNRNDTSDVGFKEFLRWVTIIETSDKEKQKSILSSGKYDFPYEEISFNDVYRYWKIVEFIFDKWEDRSVLEMDFLSPKEEDGYTITQIDCFKLLPLIVYCRKYENPDDRNLLRLFKFLENLTRLDNVSKAVNELVSSVIQIARNYDDVVEILSDITNTDGEEKISATILTNEEKRKLEILRDSDNRPEVEELFWKAQDNDKVQSHKIWSGEISPLLDWSITNHQFDKNKFKEYLETFDKLFVGSCEDEIDLLRRTLLTKELNNYPIDGSLSFGWSWDSWHKIIFENSDKLKVFFDQLHGKNVEDIKKYMEQLCSDYKGNSQWIDFIKFDYLLKYCKGGKRLIKRNDELQLVQRSYAKPISVFNARLLYELGADWENTVYNRKEFCERWKFGFYQDQNHSCIAFDNSEKDIAIDINCKQNNFNVFLFRHNNKDTDKVFEDICKDDWKWEDNCWRWYKEVEFNGDYQEIINYIRNLTKLLNNF